jgi:flagellar L-ring protein precursor FlgH
MRLPLLLALLAMAAACGRFDHVGTAPPLSPTEGTQQHSAMYAIPLPDRSERRRAADEASLWSAGQRSLLGDRRAARRGDILTVVIDLDDRAEMSNTSSTNRTNSQGMRISDLFGIPQRINEHLPEGASLDPAVGVGSDSSFRGNGATRRNERLTLRIATTVVEELPNGILRLHGTQEVRVNNELRELVVTGFVRPEDISRRNEIGFDKIAGARIAYGGRGIITTVQQPRWGQQVLDTVLPF